MNKFLLFLLAVPTFSIAQAPVNQYMGNLCPSCNEFTSDGINHRNYDLVESSSPLDQTAAGANAIWDFADLDIVGNIYYDVSTPTTAQTGTYPNTTSVLSVFGSIEQGQIFIANGGTFTGVTSSEFSLNYSSNNATMGTFPLTYGYSNTDSVSGTYVYGDYSGTFTGNLVTTVDAYGVLSNYAFEGAPRNVTRLKTVQTLTMNYVPFGNVGTLTQTIYHYYDNDPSWLWPQFRSTTTVISIPLLGVNETTNVYEQQIQAFMATRDGSAPKISIAPNPATNSIRLSGNTAILSFEIVDISGKKLLSLTNPGSDIDVENLAKGTYLAKIETAEGIQNRKFVKK